MNRLISVGELRAEAIKHLVDLSVEHEFFCHFFSQRKTGHEIVFTSLLKGIYFNWEDFAPFWSNLFLRRDLLCRKQIEDIKVVLLVKQGSKSFAIYSSLWNLGTQSAFNPSHAE